MNSEHAFTFEQYTALDTEKGHSQINLLTLLHVFPVLLKIPLEYICLTMKDKVILSKYKNDHEITHNEKKLVLINVLDRYYVGHHLPDPN